MVLRSRGDDGRRLAFLEGTVGEHSHILNGIRDAMTSLEARMDRRFEQIEVPRSRRTVSS
jgi:hypothetical protein